MDPNLFHLDWERLWEVIVAISVLAILLERALSLVFEHRVFVERFGGKGLKEFIAFGMALWVAWYWDFDAVSMIILKAETTIPGYLITAGIIAGGSKGSVKLFQDLMNIQSTASRAAKGQQAATTES